MVCACPIAIEAEGYDLHAAFLFTIDVVELHMN